MVEVGSFSAGSTGNKTILLNNSTLTPVYMEFEAGPRFNTTETTLIRSSGATDGARSYTISTYADSTQQFTKDFSNTYCIAHYTNVGGVMTKKLSGTIVSFGLGQFVINMDAADSNYKIRFKAFS